tara:strand:- start:343 stop:849 length:507 start_codon:yes stop_codon:yes gene_type:complete
MAGKVKMVKNMSFEYVLGIVGVLILVFALYSYSNNKNLQVSAMQGISQEKAISPSTANVSPPIAASSSNVVPSKTQEVTDPSELLPSNSNSWGSVNPNPTPGLENVSLLNDSTKLNGIDTVGNSLRNANLQLRSDPPNPRGNTNCPWNNSTIDGDPFRRPLEIGTVSN